MRWWRRRIAPAATVPRVPPTSPPPPVGVDGSAPPSQPLPARPALPRGAIILASAGGATLAVIGISAMQSYLAPFLLAIVLTICVHPLRVLLERRGVPRSLATGSVVLTVFLLLLAFVGAFVVAVGQFASLLPQFAAELGRIGANVEQGLLSIGIGPEQVRAIIAGLDPGNLIALATALFGSLSGITFGLVVILTALILLAVDASYLPILLTQLRPARPHLVDSLGVFARGVRRYMVATAGLGLLQAVLNVAALAILGVPGAVLWGLLTFLCSFIPNVGYFIAIAPPLFFGYLTGGWSSVIWVIVIYAVINGVVQSIVHPAVVGNAVALNQSLTFFSVLFWTPVLGPIGAILAIPLTLFVRMLLVDSNPDARIWRAPLGDLDDAKATLREQKRRRRVVEEHQRLDGPLS